MSISRTKVLNASLDMDMIDLENIPEKPAVAAHDPALVDNLIDLYSSTERLFLRAVSTKSLLDSENVPERGTSKSIPGKKADGFRRSMDGIEEKSMAPDLAPSILDAEIIPLQTPQGGWAAAAAAAAAERALKRQGAHDGPIYRGDGRATGFRDPRAQASGSAVPQFSRDRSQPKSHDYQSSLEGSRPRPRLGPRPKPVTVVRLNIPETRLARLHLDPWFSGYCHMWIRRPDLCTDDDCDEMHTFPPSAEDQFGLISVNVGRDGNEIKKRRIPRETLLRFLRPGMMEYTPRCYDRVCYDFHMWGRCSFGQRCWYQHSARVRDGTTASLGVGSSRLSAGNRGMQ